MARPPAIAEVLAAAVLAALAGVRVAQAQTSAFDPKDYLDRKAIEDAKNPPELDTVRQNVVKIDGRPYYKFGSERGAILVPKFDNLSKQDFESALCSDRLQTACDPNKIGMETDPVAKQACAAQGLGEALVARAEAPVSEDAKVYLGLIVQTIQTTCGGGGAQPNAIDLARFLEIGIEWKSKDERRPNSKKVFIRPIPTRPEIGVGTSF